MRSVAWACPIMLPRRASCPVLELRVLCPLCNVPPPPPRPAVPVLVAESRSSRRDSVARGSRNRRLIEMAGPSNTVTAMQQLSSSSAASAIAPLPPATAASGFITSNYVQLHPALVLAGLL